MLETLGKPYIVSAGAKGLSRKEVMSRHARKNAKLSVVTMSGSLLGNMLTGLAIAEFVFNYPGVGLLTAMMFLAIDLVVAILYAYIDPESKYRRI